MRELFQANADSVTVPAIDACGDAHESAHCFVQ